MDKPLWQPTSEQRQSCNMARFMEFVNRTHQLSLSDYPSLYQWTIVHKAEFWSSVWNFCGVIASQPWQSVIHETGAFPGYEWFKGSRLNFAENLLKHARPDNHNPAIIFRGEDRVKHTLSFAELYQHTARLAAALRKAGVTAGDRVAGFMPNVPETIIAMLATTSIGAIWSSCSPDFGVNGVLDRFGQIEPKILFCCDGYYFKGKPIDAIATVQQIARDIPNLKHIVVIPYLAQQPDLPSLPKAITLGAFTAEETATHIDYAQLPFMHPVYIMYSSGTTGKPKCIVHGAGGTLLQHLKELVLHTDVRPGERIFYFTTCGWMMWNWLVSNLAVGATVILYDGAPLYPHADSLFAYANQEQFSVFGASAKYLSALEKSGAAPKQQYRLDNLRCILSTGSPLLPESYDYVYQKIKPDLQLASISGGTDIISCFALGNPLLPVYKGELQCIGLGMEVMILDEAGKPVRQQKGELSCKPPFPSMPVYFWNDPAHKKYRNAYFANYPDVWTHGDYAEITRHNGLIIYGRSDAVLNPGGVRIGTAEIYRQVEKLPEILESIAVGQQWEGDTRIVLFVKLAENLKLDGELKTKIKNVIRTNTTPRHVPAKIIQVPDIPRTISGKIVELAVGNVIHGLPVKNRDALANPEALAAFANLAELQEA
ncbi:MAG: acetoacetate--CoA ligase [Gammaproteobacteria bacterium]|nr:acetoacetate--CoA ligase [Gammaproteobacteria bacterium]